TFPTRPLAACSATQLALAFPYALPLRRPAYAPRPYVLYVFDGLRARGASLGRGGTLAIYRHHRAGRVGQFLRAYRCDPSHRHRRNRSTIFPNSSFRFFQFRFFYFAFLIFRNLLCDHSALPRPRGTMQLLTTTMAVDLYVQHRDPDGAVPHQEPRSLGTNRVERAEREDIGRDEPARGAELSDPAFAYF